MYALLHEHGLDRFYDLGGGKGHPVGAVPEPSRSEWLAELEQQGDLGNGSVRVVLDIQGIHCAACVWVLQELWRRRDGALQIRINPSLGQAELSYDRARLALPAFLHDVERLGYRVAPPSKVASTERGLLVRTGVCVALAMNAMMFAATEYFGLSARDGSTFTLFRGISFALATVALIAGGPVFFRAAVAGLRRRVLHLDLPIALGVALAWSGSTFAFLSGHGDAYFDTVTIFIALMLLGRYLQQRAVAKNREYLLADDGLAHVRVRRLRADELELVAVQGVRAGDTLLLTPGDLLPVAARLQDAQASFSLDWINGESEPRAFAAGAAVPAGAFLADRRPARVVATAPVQASGLLALLSPGPQRDDLRAHGKFWYRWNRAYVAIVLVLACVACVAWLVIDPARAVSVTIAVLVVTCPCALGIATPLAFDLAIAWLRRQGVLVCAASVLEKARHVRKVLLDKTGTVTWGTLHAEVVQPPPPALRGVLLALASGSNHPVSRAVAAAAGGGDKAPWIAGGAIEETPGAGIELRTEAATYRLGQRRFATSEDGPAGECVFSENGAVRARFAVHEDLRAGFAAEVHRWSAMGLKVHVLSGDKQAKVDRVARAIGVPAARARGDLSPADKAAYVRALDADDTLMLGDGLNDAPAFAAAFVAGTPALDRPVLPARADFCYAGGRPEAVREVIAQSHRFHAVVATNLALGLAYNVLVVALSLLGRMSPVLCAILMPASSLVLIAHTTWRLRSRPRPSAPDVPAALGDERWK